MFKNEDILEFLTRIIKNSNAKNIEASKESIEKFKEYLMLTTMCDENALNSITNVVGCFEELVNIYEKTGICDLTAIFNSKEKRGKKQKHNVANERVDEEQATALVKKRTFDRPYQEKHYDRYIPTSGNYTSGCASRSSYGSSCGSGGSYGSSC